MSLTLPQFYRMFVVKICIGDVHCPATGTVRGNGGHYSCVTDIIF